MSAALWSSNSGRVSCVQHAGTYFRQTIEAKPTVKKITTPLDVWTLVTDADREEWLRELGFPIDCETCKNDADRARR